MGTEEAFYWKNEGLLRVVMEWMREGNEEVLRVGWMFLD